VGSKFHDKNVALDFWKLCGTKSQWQDWTLGGNIISNQTDRTIKAVQALWDNSWGWYHVETQIKNSRIPKSTVTQSARLNKCWLYQLHKNCVCQIFLLKRHHSLPAILELHLISLLTTTPVLHPFCGQFKKKKFFFAIISIFHSSQ